MPAFYTIVQYVPDPIADERINVGVIVFSDGRVQSRFLRSWDRVRRFAQADIEHVQDFGEWIGTAATPSRSGHLPIALPGLATPSGPTEEDIKLIAQEWSNTIQLTSPQPSLEDPDVLLNRLAQSHLREPTARTQTFRDRQDAARLALNSVRRAVGKRFGMTEASRLVHYEYPVGGRVIPNVRVDVAVTNSRLYAVSQALSFETHDIAELDRQTRDALYTLGDIANVRDDIRLDVVALPPRTGQRNYRAVLERFESLPNMCREVRAGVVIGSAVSDWAEDVASLVPARSHIPNFPRA